MKCNEAEKYILLKDSGELSGKHASELDAHVDTCLSCRQFAQLLKESSQLIEYAEEPSLRSVQNVLRTVRTNAPVKKRHAIFGYKPLLAAAASMVLLLGLLAGYINNHRIGLEMFLSDAQLMNAEDQVVSVMYEGLSEDDLAFNFLMTYDESQEG